MPQQGIDVNPNPCAMTVSLAIGKPALTGPHDVRFIWQIMDSVMPRRKAS